MNLLLRFKPFLWRTSEPAQRNFEYFERRRLAFAVVALGGFPLYYYIWHDLFPQPYENLPLRLFGSALVLPIIFAERWPVRWRKYLAGYWFATLLFALPFFFSFMLFKNEGSAVWVESLIVAVCIMALLLDWASMAALLVVGIGLGWGGYWLTTDSPHLNLVAPEHLPVFLFAIVFGAIANYRFEFLLEQERAMLATAGSIAHELRTPLLGIKSGAAGLREYLPTLISAYLLARAKNLDIPPVRAAHLEAMRGVLERMEAEADYSNAIIDVLLVNVSLARMEKSDLTTCSLARCVELALERYPFSDSERSLVTWRAGDDIVFRGSELLMVHVVFNLIKNALQHITLAGKGNIFIWTERQEEGSRLVFRDTGSGIPAEVLPHIFKRFYSSPSIGDGILGSGIGLAFCRDVMRAIGGSIECASVPGQYTEFVLTFPENTA